MNKSPADLRAAGVFAGRENAVKNPGICRKYLNSVKHGAMIQLSSVRPKARGLFIVSMKR